jgi:outer membrane protein TolC
MRQPLHRLLTRGIIPGIVNSGGKVGRGLWRNFLLAALLGLGLGSLPGAADDGGLALSLDGAVERGLASSLNLKKNLIDLSGAEYAANHLWSEVFPTISGSTGIGYSSRLFTGSGFELNGQGASISLGLGINLGLNPGIPYAMKNISLAYQTRLLSYEDARNQLEIQITKNFYALIAERDNLAYLEDILKLAERQYERNRIGFRNGLVGEMVVTQSSLGVENARYNLSSARSSYASRMGEFLASLGLDQNARTSLEGKIEIVKLDLDAEQLIREYLPRRPDIIGRQQEIERLENAEMQTALSLKAPSLGLSAQWNFQNSNQSGEAFTDSVRGSATISIPIDPWISGTGKSQSIQNAKSAVEKARLDLQIAEDGAVTQIRSLAASLRNSWDSIEIARLSLKAAERNYQLTELGFRSGTVESLTLEDARNNLAGARQRLLQSELSYQTMTLDLSAALNINWKDLKNNSRSIP